MKRLFGDNWGLRFSVREPRFAHLFCIIFKSENDQKVFTIHERCDIIKEPNKFHKAIIFWKGEIYLFLVCTIISMNLVKTQTPLVIV